VERSKTSKPVAEPTADPLPQLTQDEDNELRRLEWISQVGTVALHKQERLMELRVRDRRQQIRPPRELEEDEHQATAREDGTTVPRLAQSRVAGYLRPVR